MKNLFLLAITIVSFIFSSCGGSEEQYNSNQEMDYFNENKAQATQVAYNGENETRNRRMTNIDVSATQSQSPKKYEVKKMTVPDGQTGRPMFYMPVPSNWSYVSNAIKGPNNFEAAQVAQVAFNGQKEKVLTVQQVNQRISEELRKEGLRVANTFNIPNIAQNQKRLDSQKWKVAPMQYTSTATGFEGVHTNGKKVLMVVIYESSRSQYHHEASFSAQMMQCDKIYFSEAKNAFINALANLTFDKQFISQWNQNQQQMCQQSNNAFQQRMRNNQRNFEAQNRATVQAGNAVNDIIMGGYQSRNASQDRIQQKAVQGIWERSTVQDPYSGQRYEVEGQADNYWMNGNGEYIPSNDPNYNPNLDSSYNGSNWNEMESYDEGW